MAMDNEELPRLDALRNAGFAEKCDFLMKRKLDELRQMLLGGSAVENSTEALAVSDEDDDLGTSNIRRPRRTASKTAGLKIKKNLNMPVKLRRPSSGNSFSGTLKSKTTRTKVIRKNDQSNPDSTSNIVEKSINVLDEMNLVKKRTEQFEKMSKNQQQQVALTPNRRNEAGNINACVATSSLDNVNNNVCAESATATTVVSVESNVVESTTTTTTTKRVTRTKTRNLKQMMADDNGNATASSSTEDVEFVKPLRSGRTKMRKELQSKLLQEVDSGKPSEREAMAQKEREKELARIAKEKAEQERKAEEARKAEEEAKRIEEEAKRAEEEARRVEEVKKAELAKKEREREREEIRARELEAAAKKKEEAAEKSRLKRLALEKKRQELLESANKKKEAIKKKHEELNKKRELDAKKREELLLVNAAKKKEAAEVNSKAQQKVADAKENMKPNQNAKPLIKPVHPVVGKLKNTTFTSSNYNMTPPRDEREPQKPKTVNNYGIDEASSDDSTDDEANPKKIVPNWAKSSQLQEMVRIQSHLPLEVFQFMMNCETDPYVTLGYVNKIKRPRTSSAVWHTPINVED